MTNHWRQPSQILKINHLPKQCHKPPGLLSYVLLPDVLWYFHSARPSANAFALLLSSLALPWISISELHDPKTGATPEKKHKDMGNASVKHQNDDIGSVTIPTPLSIAKLVWRRIQDWSRSLLLPNMKYVKMKKQSYAIVDTSFGLESFPTIA